MASLGLTPISNVQSFTDNQIIDAWVHYTGIPAAISGGLSAVGFNVASQAGQVRSGTSIFAAAKYGYTVALILEATVGTAMFAFAMTGIDPEHKVEGFGLDETRFYKAHLEGTGTKAAAFLKSTVKEPEDVTLGKRWV